MLEFARLPPFFLGGKGRTLVSGFRMIIKHITSIRWGRFQILTHHMFCTTNSFKSLLAWKIQTKKHRLGGGLKHVFYCFIFSPYLGQDDDLFWLHIIFSQIGLFPSTPPQKKNTDTDLGDLDVWTFGRVTGTPRITPFLMVFGLAWLQPYLAAPWRWNFLPPPKNTERWLAEKF